MIMQKEFLLNLALALLLAMGIIAGFYYTSVGIN